MQASLTLLQRELLVSIALTATFKLAPGSELVHFVLLDLTLEQALIVNMAHKFEMALLIAFIFELVNNYLHAFFFFCLLLSQQA